MCCRGWKASAPSGAGGFAGSPGGLGSGLGAFISSSGKSLIGPDQESSTLLKEGLWCARAGSRGYGSTKKTMCHKAAAITARRGTLLSIQQYLKNPSIEKFLGTGDLRRSTPRLLPKSEEHTSELQSRGHLVCRLLLEKKKNNI